MIGFKKYRREFKENEITKLQQTLIKIFTLEAFIDLN